MVNFCQIPPELEHDKVVLVYIICTVYILFNILCTNMKKIEQGIKTI